MAIKEVVGLISVMSLLGIACASTTADGGGNPSRDNPDNGAGIGDGGAGGDAKPGLPRADARDRDGRDSAVSMNPDGGAAACTPGDVAGLSFAGAAAPRPFGQNACDKAAIDGLYEACYSD